MWKCPVWGRQVALCVWFLEMPFHAGFRCPCSLAWPRGRPSSQVLPGEVSLWLWAVPRVHVAPSTVAHFDGLWAQGRGRLASGRPPGAAEPPVSQASLPAGWGPCQPHSPAGSEPGLWREDQV